MTKASAKFSINTATSIVIANMIGTGVFTSLGFQLLDIRSAPVILLLWVVGGLLALCGALCYAELGAALPRSGGEYNFLGQIYHPAAGFVSGWISSTIGFAAPTALAAITSATYLHAVFPAVPVVLAAAALVLCIGLVHIGSRQGSSRFQLIFTAVKVVLILIFICAAWWHVEKLQQIEWAPSSQDLPLIGSGAFAIALIYVNYAYTGWNAATYLVGEVEGGAQHLPRILLLGTGIVMALYLILHLMFLSVAPMDAMQGKLEIGYIVAEFAFGEAGSRLVGLMLAVVLVSTVSAMVIAGPRALQVIGQDFRALGFLAKENKHGIPAVAIAMQTTVTLVLVVTSTFDAILVFASFTLALNTLLTVLGVYFLRRKMGGSPAKFSVPWYPWPMVIYVGITLWTLVFVVWERPIEALVGAGLILAGWLFYLFSRDRVEVEDHLPE